MAGPSSAELMASGAISSGSTSSSNLNAGENTAGSTEGMPQTITPHKISILGMENAKLGSFLENPGIGVPGTGSGSVFSTDLDTVNNIAPGKVTTKIAEDVSGLGAMDLGQATGVAENVNFKTPQTLQGQGGQEH